MDGSFSFLFVLFCRRPSGFSGFAMGLVVSGVWLHIIPMQIAALIASCSLLTKDWHPEIASGVELQNLALTLGDNRHTSRCDAVGLNQSIEFEVGVPPLYAVRFSAAASKQMTSGSQPISGLASSTVLSRPDRTWRASSRASPASCAAGPGRPTRCVQPVLFAAFVIICIR